MVETLNIRTITHCPAVTHSQSMPRCTDFPSHSWEVLPSGSRWIFPGYCAVMTPVSLRVSLQDVPCGDGGKVLNGLL